MQSLWLKSHFIKVSHPFSCTKCDRDGLPDSLEQRAIAFPILYNLRKSQPEYINMKTLQRIKYEFCKDFLFHCLWIAKLKGAGSVWEEIALDLNFQFPLTFQLHVQWVYHKFLVVYKNNYSFLIFCFCLLLLRHTYFTFYCWNREREMLFSVYIFSFFYIAGQ